MSVACNWVSFVLEWVARLPGAAVAEEAHDIDSCLHASGDVFALPREPLERRYGYIVPFGSRAPEPAFGFFAK